MLSDNNCNTEYIIKLRVFHTKIVYLIYLIATLLSFSLSFRNIHHITRFRSKHFQTTLVVFLSLELNST